MNFEYIHEFNNTKSLAVIGNATTEMCKPLLMEIGRTIGAYERQIARQNASNKAREKVAGEHIGSHEENVEKGLANAPEADYNALKRESETAVEKPKETENHTEMEGIANETDIRKERGLSDSEPDSERGAGTGTDQVRTDEEELSEAAQERDLSGNDTDRGTESTLSAGTGAGRAENGNADRTDGEVGGSERGTESSRSDALGRVNPNFWIFRKIPTLKKSKLSHRYADKYGIVRKKSLDFFLTFSIFSVRRNLSVCCSCSSIF